jgi:hypothetical protein
MEATGLCVCSAVFSQRRAVGISGVTTVGMDMDIHCWDGYGYPQFGDGYGYPLFGDGYGYPLFGDGCGYPLLRWIWISSAWRWILWISHNLAKVRW